MGFLTWLVRVLVAAFALRLVMRMFRGASRKAPRTAPRKPAERIGGTLVRDPQCGTYVTKHKAIVVGRGADAKHFCSAACRDQYLESHGQRHAS